MLGNFSFGDYFKKEAISWAWEFLTERMEIDPLDLWVTVYKDDDEAFELWNKMIGLPEEKIVRLGKDDNFWELEVGPSGPCSEIYVDRGIEYGCGDENCKPGCECDRFLEIWNLVFTQFDKDENGVYHPLPNPNIDTGMGLERMATVMEGTNNIFEIGAIRSILRKVEEISKYNYGSDEEKDVSVRVITDHARAMTFLVSDGVLPSNEGRGYVLRRLIRRASRHGKLLGINGGFLSEVVDVVINSWQIEYKDLKEKDKEIKKVIQAEEAKFQETIDQGISILEDYINEMRKKKKSVLSGEKAFKLYDTYGFPLDLTKEILLEKNLSLNEEEFKLNMERQRRRARNSRDSGDSGWGGKESKELFKDINSTFKGYETVKLETEIISLIKDNTKVNELSRFEEGVVILKETPFYGESGGQVGDKGKISGDNFILEVLDTKLYDDLRLHNVKVVEGEVKLGDKVTASVDVLRRDAIRRNHSATHLLHKALKEVLGEHVNQAGSYVTPDRLRFDFTHFESITPNDLKKVEDRVNEMIFKGLDVETIETTLDEAYKLDAIGLFEEKYKNDVRIVKMGNYSQELCGGTHVVNTSNIGLFKIISETSIASGFRRIEAITGLSVLNFLNSIERELDELSNILKTNNTNIIEKATQIVEDIKERDKEIEKLKGKLSSNIADEIIDSKKEVKDIQYIVYKLKDMDMNSLRNLGDEIRNRLGSGVVVLASVLNDKISYVVMVTKDINKKGILAGNIIKEIAKVSGGNGGGRADMAQAGGKDISKVDESLLIVEGLIEKQMNN
jgi:alanyl-tRNA synthetase